MANQWVNKNQGGLHAPNHIEWVACDRQTYLAYRDAGYNCAEFSGGEFPIHMQLRRVTAEELAALLKLIEAEG